MRRGEQGSIVMIHNRPARRVPLGTLHISEARATIVFRCRCLLQYGSLIGTRTRCVIYRGRS